ncbi:hypothetical protein ELY21_03235 [Legionella sp. km535]|uniref:hypothetical protein n=1 Tax=Legionella sp. km535 TaxID=2498107 RepID=UPI000F8DC383|nr:hypothetical protein [Legionella sp. km535]RUR19624.1 hypothetical protein ELY21_03235 [Legionella sp. km535]
MSNEKKDRLSGVHSLFSNSEAKNCQSSKTVIIERYSDSDYKPKESAHELNSNTEISYLLRLQTKQKQRFIYAPDEQTQEKIITTQDRYGYPCELVFLDDPESITQFLDHVSTGDSLLIIAQGCLNEHLIAGLDADSYIEWITEDLELADKELKQIELYSCNMGSSDDYINELKHGLSSVCHRLVAYKTLCGAGKEGKVFIKESGNNKDQDLFYDESNLPNELKVVEYIRPYNNQKCIRQ